LHETDDACKISYMKQMMHTKYLAWDDRWEMTQNILHETRERDDIKYFAWDERDAYKISYMKWDREMTQNILHETRDDTKYFA